jgi:hypothetical protein
MHVGDQLRIEPGFPGWRCGSVGRGWDPVTSGDEGGEGKGGGPGYRTHPRTVAPLVRRLVAGVPVSRTGIREWVGVTLVMGRMVFSGRSMMGTGQRRHRLSHEDQGEYQGQEP